MIKKVISGFQSGAEIAGIYAAVECGIPTGGMMTMGFLTEDGPRPEYERLYGAVDSGVDNYSHRAQLNVRDSDFTLWFGKSDSYGYRLTTRSAARYHVPFIMVDTRSDLGSLASTIIFKGELGIVNIAGNFESSSPGVFNSVKQFLIDLFSRTKKIYTHY